MARFFKKLYQNQKDILTEDFPELEDDSKIGDHLGFKVITNLKKDFMTFKTTGFKAPNGNDVEGTLEPELKFSEYDIILKGKIQTTNKYEATLSLNDKVVKGSTVFVTGRAEVGDKPKKTLEFGVDYLNKEYGSLNLKVITPHSFDTKDIELYAAFVGYYQGASIGGDVQLKVVAPEKETPISKWNGYLQYDYSSNNYSSALFGKHDKKKGTRVGFGHYQIVNDTITGALELSVDPQSVDNSNLKFGGSYKFDKFTTLRPRVSVYSKTKEVRLGFVLKQTLSDIAKLTFTTDLSTSTLFQQEGKFIPNQYGVTVSFFD